MGLPDCKNPFVVKKGNTYTCITTDRFKFLDVRHYLAAGYSYDAFLKAYHVPVRKSFFPYEYFDDVRKLELPSLPGPDAFISRLKGKRVNTLGKDKEEIITNYEGLLQVGRDRGMTRFQDFLVYYNCLDVEPFVEAVNRMMQFYLDRQMDIFKMAISAPGIARVMLYKSAQSQGVNFALFDTFQKDTYHTFKANLTGGPSIIFKRHLEVGKSLIRGDPLKPCKKVLGYDANALYLWAIGQDQPAGRFVIRKAEHGFCAEIRDKYTSAFDYLDWNALKRGIFIQHGMNGKEFRVGPYFVDGYCAQTNTVYEYNGRYLNLEI